MAWCYSHAGDHGNMSKEKISTYFSWALLTHHRRGVDRASCHKRQVKLWDAVLLTLDSSGSIF